MDGCKTVVYAPQNTSALEVGACCNVAAWAKPGNIMLYEYA